MGVRRPTEADVQRAVLALLRLRGAWCLRVNTARLPDPRTGRRVYAAHDGGPGVPDIVGLYRGVGFGLECKRPGGKATPEQLAHLDAIRRAGGVGVVVRSVDDAAAVLADIDRRVAAAGD